MVARRRAPHQLDHTQEEARPFVDALAEIRMQPDQEDAPPYRLHDDECDTDDAPLPLMSHIDETRSLDDLFPNLGISQLFASSTDFRRDLRHAMRQDVFHTTPAYHGMSEKAQTMLLLPDSSLQGSWKCCNGAWAWPEGNKEQDSTNEQEEESSPPPRLRMKKLTAVLSRYLEPYSLHRVTSLWTRLVPCVGQSPRHIGLTLWALVIDASHTHFIKIRDAFLPPTPKRSCLDFQHKTITTALVSLVMLSNLKRNKWAPKGHPPNEPVLYNGLRVGDKYIVRPRWAKGREIIVYRDVDVLHSAPDVAYRDSVMRFM